MDFSYLDPQSFYFDSACQTLRPIPVIEAQDGYFREYNACAGRVKYAWGQRVDAAVEETRQLMLDAVGLSSKEYTCAFTLNTTYGINLIASQLPSGRFQRVVTSEIEHNSVFLTSIALAERLGIERKVLAREADGTLVYDPKDFENAVIMLNAVSNIDGRQLKNIADIVKDAHQRSGIVLIDAAQAFAHGTYTFKGIKADGIFTSAHKMYGPSLGMMIVHRHLVDSLTFGFLGGGTVQDVDRDNFTLIPDGTEAFARLEPGLQNFSGIIGLKAALEWQKSFRPENRTSEQHQEQLSTLVFESLKSNPNVELLNAEPSTITSFYTPKIDAHRLALFLSAQGIMARSGYFCCHYYLKNLKRYPPLLRLSLGLHNTVGETERMLETLHTIIRNA